MQRRGHAVDARVFELLVEQERCTVRAFRADDALQRLQPFLGFLGIDVAGARGAQDLLWYGRHGGLLGAIRVASVEAGALCKLHERAAQQGLPDFCAEFYEDTQMQHKLNFQIAIWFL